MNSNEYLEGIKEEIKQLNGYLAQSNCDKPYYDDLNIIETLVENMAAEIEKLKNDFEEFKCLSHKVRTRHLEVIDRLQAELEKRRTAMNELDIYVLTDSDGDPIVAFSNEGKAKDDAEDSDCHVNKIKCIIYV